MKIGYARVSTAGQDLEVQIQMLKEAGCDKIYEEKYTGTTTKRPVFNQVIEKLKEGDTLIVTKLDRFARSTHEALGVIRDLFKRGVTVNVLNLGIIEDTPTGRLIFTIFTAFADFERDMIIERTQEGKRLAKLDPEWTEGRPPKFSNKQLEHALELKKTKSYKQVQELTGISKTTLWRYSKQKEALNH